MYSARLTRHKLKIKMTPRIMIGLFSGAGPFVCIKVIKLILLSIN
jgi:hypothetical protein